MDMSGRWPTGLVAEVAQLVTGRRIRRENSPRPHFCYIFTNYLFVVNCLINDSLFSLV